MRTTNGGAETPFYVTANEVRVSREHASDYWLYKVHTFAKEPRYRPATSASASLTVSSTLLLSRSHSGPQDGTASQRR